MRKAETFMTLEINKKKAEDIQTWKINKHRR